jgi:hypothetical protein
MAYKQLIIPNDDPYYATSDGNAWMGWCLAVCAESFAQGTPKQARQYRSDTALIESGKVNLQKNKNYPIGVWFPVWFSGYKGFGHVIRMFIHPDGRASYWTSPKTKKWTADSGTLANSEEVLGYIWNNWGLKDGAYIGWSDNICGLKICEWVEDPVPVEPPVTPPAEPEPQTPPTDPTPPVEPPTEPPIEPQVPIDEEPIVEQPKEDMKQDMSQEEQDALLATQDKANTAIRKIQAAFIPEFTNQTKKIVYVVCGIGMAVTPAALALLAVMNWVESNTALFVSAVLTGMFASVMGVFISNTNARNKS